MHNTQSSAGKFAMNLKAKGGRSKWLISRRHSPRPSRRVGDSEVSLKQRFLSQEVFPSGQGVRMQGKLFTTSEEATALVSNLWMIAGQHLCRKKDIMWVLACRTWAEAGLCAVMQEGRPEERRGIGFQSYLDRHHTREMTIREPAAHLNGQEEGLREVSAGMRSM